MSSITNFLGYENPITLRVQRLNESVPFPIREEGAVGYNLTSLFNLNIPFGRRALVPTGIAVELPQGTFGRIVPARGLSMNQGVDVSADIICMTM